LPDLSEKETVNFVLLFGLAKPKSLLFLPRGAHRAPPSFTNRRKSFIRIEFVAGRERRVPVRAKEKTA
jgi:hypothetical protein